MVWRKLLECRKSICNTVLKVIKSALVGKSKLLVALGLPMKKCSILASWVGGLLLLFLLIYFVECFFIRCHWDKVLLINYVNKLLLLPFIYQGSWFQCWCLWRSNSHLLWSSMFCAFRLAIFNIIFEVWLLFFSCLFSYKYFFLSVRRSIMLVACEIAGFVIWK